MTNFSNVAENNNFKNFALSGSVNNYFIQPDAVAVRSNNVPQEDRIAITKENQPPKKSHKKRNLAYAVGSSTLIVTGGVLLLTKGLPKNTHKYLESLKKYMENKLEKANIKGSDRWGEFWERSIRRVDSFIEKSQSINNFTTLKDIGFKRLMDISKPTANLHKKITTFFERIARRTVVKSYKTTTKNFNKMYGTFDKLDEIILKSNPDEIIKYKGKEYTKRELIELAQKHRERIKSSVSDFTSEGSLLGRYKYMKKATASLYSHFWDKVTNKFWSKDNAFLSKDMWQTYIPDAQLTGDKKTLSEQVAAIRKCISYTDKDKTFVVSRYVKTLKNLIPPSDKDGLTLIKKLEWFLDNPEGLSQNKENILKLLKAIKDRPFEKGLDNTIIQNQTKLRQSNIDAIIGLLDEKSNGELQEMVDIYKQIAPYELAKTKAEKTVRKAVSSFDNALKTETTEFFDKLRDLQLGSAPTDVISILAPTAMIGYGLLEAADTDERKSVMYTAGIPILGSVVTTIYCTTKLVSGGISLGIAAATGAIFKIVGDIIDKYRPKAVKNHTNG